MCEKDETESYKIMKNWTQRRTQKNRQKSNTWTCIQTHKHNARCFVVRRSRKKNKKNEPREINKDGVYTESCATLLFTFVNRRSFELFDIYIFFVCWFFFASCCKCIGISRIVWYVSICIHACKWDRERSRSDCITWTWLRNESHRATQSIS